MPVRIQRKRTSGWRKPEGALDCTRGGPRGNPWSAPEYDYTVAESIERFEALTLPNIDLAPIRAAEYVMCWCPLDQPCHVDSLIRAAGTGKP